MDIINDSKLLESLKGDNFCFKFRKDIKFRQLYDLLKRYKQYIFNPKIPQWPCLCEICENALFLVDGLNKKLYSESRLPTTINKLVVRFSCDNVKKCIFGECEKCSSINVSHEDFNVDLVADSDSENSTTSVSDCDDNDQGATVPFYEWAREDTKLKKMLFKESIDSAIRKFKSTVTTLKHHIYIKSIQFNYYNNIKNNLGKSDLLVHDEYSQSYENKQQHGIQRTYFGHTTLAYSLHAVTFKILKIILLANLSPSPVNFLTIQDLQLPPSQRLLRI